jgi:hypothetical protein
VACAIALASAIASAACSAPPVTAPSPALTTADSQPQRGELTLTVLVLERTSEVPIHGALVRYKETNIYSDATGQAVVPVTAGEETAIVVSAPAHEPMSASAVLNNSERWTFYLARESAE